MKLSFYPEGYSTYSIIDLAVTLRCNWKCRNCLRFCEMYDLTGLDYSDSDMSLDQINLFISQVENIWLESGNMVFSVVQLSGGEPLLHPNIIEIANRILDKLTRKNIVGRLIINSNMVESAPKEIESYIVNYSSVEQKPKEHAAVLMHPDDRAAERPTYSSCNYHGKSRVVLTYQGYNLCCVADGYIRLFCADNLITNDLPKSVEGFPEIDRVCQHCSFGCKIEKLERDIGRPISEIYLNEIKLNKSGRRIRKIFH
jgi:organic radical activating enzyme